MKYFDEFRFVARLDNADLFIVSKSKIKPFHLPNHVHYNVIATTIDVIGLAVYLTLVTWYLISV